MVWGSDDGSDPFFVIVDPTKSPFMFYSIIIIQDFSTLSKENDDKNHVLLW